MSDKLECPNCKAIMVMNTKEGVIECNLCGYSKEINGKKYKGDYIR